MFFHKKKINKSDSLYSKLVLLSREKYLYVNFKIPDNLSSRIYLIFIFTSFILINLKGKSQKAKILSQNIFDNMFKQIETHLREIGMGDVSINKKMKKLINLFYNILLKCENFENFKETEIKVLFRELFYSNKDGLNAELSALIDYIDKFKFFSINLSLNNIENGDINFEN